MDWKKEAERLKFCENKSWAEITNCLQPKFFADKDTAKVREIVRSYIRGTDEYKRQQSVNSETDDIDSKSSFEYKADGTSTSDKIISICVGETLTPDLIMEKHNLDSKLWQVVSYKNNFWHSQVKGGKRLVMYQSKLTVRPYKQNEISLEEVREHFEKFQKTYKPSAPQIKTESSNKMLEVNISDLHLGKLAWNRETGENYDYKIARKRFFQIIDAEVERVKQGNFELILFAWCNDFSILTE